MPPFDMFMSIPALVSMLSFRFSLLFAFLHTICILFAFFLSFSFTSEAVPEHRFYICSNTTTFSPNSAYQSNLNQLLSSLTSNASRAEIGFYSTTAGQDPGNVVYGSFLCRGDLTIDVCRDCVAYVVKEVVKFCPIEKVSVIWYDQCMLRYSNVSFFGLMDESPSASVWNKENITEPEQFNDLLGDTMNGLVTAAANAQSGTKKFATKEASFSGFETLYSLVQCTPDLSSSDCNRCLRVVVAGLPNCCAGKRGGSIMNPSCNVRYEVHPFYNVTVVAPPPSPELPRPPPPLMLGTPSKGKISSVTIIAIVVSIAVALLLLLGGYYLLIRRARDPYNAIQEENAGNDISTTELLQIDFGTIEAATNNFSEDNKLGVGGFGVVYKGVLRNGQEIAVKRLSMSSGQGAEEFTNEVVLVAKLQHRNLTKLLGFCLEGEENILIYEFVPNKSLDHFLTDPKKRAQLDWSIRYKIIGGVARGILYLHEDSRLRIIHRDLKSNNILLDIEMNPKISDFGMAKLFRVDQTQGNTSRIVGTYGYMAPEYAFYGQFSVKSDVYSFGILILEIIAGKKNSSFYQLDADEDLLTYAWKHWSNGTPLELLDPIMGDSYSRDEVVRCIHIGLLCVQEDPAYRPTMASIVLMLNSYSVTLASPQKPTFFPRSRTMQDMPTIQLESDQSTSKSSKSCTINEMSISEIDLR